MFLDTVKNPELWQKIRTDETYRPLIDAMLQSYEKDAVPPITEIPYTMAADFFVSGDRATSEAIYFVRRRALCTCAILALIYPEERKYFDRMQDFLFAICNEYTWEIPAHTPNMTDYIPDDIDLFASETGYALSEIYKIFEEKLDPLVKTRIKMEVERRIITPFADYNRRFAWIGFKSNWAAVCGASVAACFIYLAPERFKEVQPRIDEAINNYLISYQDSGYCIEGISYWEYGFGFFTCYAQMMYDFTGGKVDYFKMEKVKAIASFAQKMFLSGQTTVSFSDGKMEGSVSRGICHYLAKKYPDTVFPYPQTVVSAGDFCGRWCYTLRGVVWFDPSTERQIEEFSDYSKDVEWLVYRTKTFGFAAKAGKNWEAHNHNDVGSFIFAANGKQIFADVGAGEYTRQYFREETRYQYFNTSSRSHSVPILFGNYQKTGGRYRAENTVWNGKTFSYDYASAYDDERVTSLKRFIDVDKKGITVRNQITFAEGFTPSAGDYIERYVLTEKPQIEQGKLVAGGVVATYKGAGLPTVSVQMVTPHNPAEGDYPVYLVDFAVQGTEFEIRIEPENK
ncbi:MAG: heparinase II/III family protein [Clostridia bacterium]|nr:heparinase II/III family protein [Clostridia bacterium]